MAEKLRDFDFTQSSQITSTEKVSYPWNQWLDGDIWQLTQGVDFLVHPLMMERIIRTRATGRNSKIQMRHLPLNGDPFGVIVMQRTDVEGPTAAKRREASEKRRQKREQATREAAEFVKAHAPGKGNTIRPSKRPAKRVPTKRPARV